MKRSRNLLLFFLIDGYNQERKAQILTFTQSSLSRDPKRFSESQDISIYPGQGYPRDITLAQDHLWLLHSMRNRTTTAKNLQAQLREALWVRIRDETVRNKPGGTSVKTKTSNNKSTSHQAKHHIARLSFDWSTVILSENWWFCWINLEQSCLFYLSTITHLKTNDN